MGKGDGRLHARTLASQDDMAARWERTFKTLCAGDGEAQSADITDAERDALWRRIRRARHGDGGCE